MSQIITKGFLIARFDHDTFDEIITFINDYGNKFVCLAKGTKKISSKNARNLQIGNYCEFNFFLARDPNKMSRLVKVNTIKQIRWPIYRTSFFLLNEMANKLVYPSMKNFNFYKDLLPITINSSFNDQKAQLIILQKFCKLSGIELFVNKCILCGSNKIKTMNFNLKGLICQNCFKQNNKEFYPLNFNKLVYFLFKEKYDLIDNFSNYCQVLIKHLIIHIKNNLGINILDMKFFHFYNKK